MKYKIRRIVALLLLSSVFLYGCNSKPKEPADASKQSEEPGDLEKEEGDGEEQQPGNESQQGDKSPEQEKEDIPVYIDPNYDLSFNMLYEAEDGRMEGRVRADSSKQGFSGNGYVVGIENNGDEIHFTVEVPGDGSYDLNFISASFSGYKENYVLIDGEQIGTISVNSEEFTDSLMERVYLAAGEHEITIRKHWGWIYLDSLRITASEPIDNTIYSIQPELVDPKATDRTKRLMKYLTDMYGNYVISGQYSSLGYHGFEFRAIHDNTGKYPAMLGLDMIEYSPSRAANGSVGKSLEHALKFDREGGIVTFCWHWNVPEPYLLNTSDQPWWKGFYTEAVNIDLAKIMNGEDPEGYDLLLADIDAIAIQLKRLQDNDIPILWRPLHEAAGGWFWWGDAGPDAYIQLYRLLFDRLTNYHEIHNLIWVWNGQGEEWYPGSEYVDIAGYDIYPGERVYTSQSAKFFELADWTKEDRKIIALTENGCLFDPDLAFRDQAKWAYFGTWEGEFVTLNKTFTLSEKYTDKEMLSKVYNHERVITLDELPDLKTYGW